jgi:hypothetical protein
MMSEAAAVPSVVGQRGVDLQGGRHELHRFHDPLAHLPDHPRALGRQRGGSAAQLLDSPHHLYPGFCDVFRDAGWHRNERGSPGITDEISVE